MKHFCVKTSIVHIACYPQYIYFNDFKIIDFLNIKSQARVKGYALLTKTERINIYCTGF